MASRTPEIENSLPAIRERRGLSASALAKEVGISRQAIYAVEAGTYVPNTVVGLRLARALDVTLDELFSLPEASLKQKSRSEKATLIPSASALREGQPVQLCEVDGRLMALPVESHDHFLPWSDAIALNARSVRGKINVSLHGGSENFANRLLIAGCDPAMAILARHLQPAGVGVILLHRNSSQSLALLKRGCVHIAGTHLGDASEKGANLKAVGKNFGSRAVAVISFAMWEEGLLTVGGNPKNIRGIEDLTRGDVRFVNREAGSGSRFLLDNQLLRLGITSKRVRGYERLASGHLAAAALVHEGRADCCLATQSAARLFGLSFVPLQTERFDFVIRRDQLASPAVQTLLNTMNRANFRRELTGVGGYDTTVTGERVL